MKRLFFIVLSFVLSSMLRAQTTYIWTGATSPDWNKASNWNQNTVPTSTSKVVIAAGKLYYPVLASDVVVTEINMTGGSLDISSRNFTVKTTVNFSSGLVNGSGNLNIGSVGTPAATNNISGTVFDPVITCYSVFSNLINNTFNSKISITKTGSVAVDISKGNVYNATLEWNNNGGADINLSTTAPVDSYNESLVLGSTSAKAIVIGFGSDISQRTFIQNSLLVPSGRFSAGTIRLSNIKQVNYKASNSLNLSGTSKFMTLSFNDWSGPFILTAPDMDLKAGIFNEVTTITKNNSGNTSLSGGNDFNMDLTITNLVSNSEFDFAAVSYDTYEGNVILNGSGNISMATSGGESNFYKDVVINNEHVKFGSATGIMALDGSFIQNIRGSATNIQNVYKLLINNAAGVNLQLKTNILLDLNLLKGNFNTTSTAVPIVANGATFTGGSTQSFISGPAIKVGNSTFAAPVGKGNKFSPITFSVVSDALANDCYQLEYFNQAPIGGFISPVSAVSNVEYWEITRLSGAAKVKASFDWNAGNLGDNTCFTMAKFNGFSWIDAGRNDFIVDPGGVSGSFSTGIIQGTNLGKFALASNCGNTTIVFTLPSVICGASSGGYTLTATPIGGTFYENGLAIPNGILPLSSAGIHTITYKVNNSSKTAVTTISPTLTVAVTATDVSVSTACDATATPVVTGGKSPFTYKWTGPSGYVSTIASPTNLCLGTYNLVVKDVNQCIANASITVTTCTINQLTAKIKGTCDNCTDGSIELLGLHSEDYYIHHPSYRDNSCCTITWSGTSQKGAYINHLSAGTYTATIKCGGCITIKAFVVPNYADPIITGTIKNATTSCNGAIDATVTGAVQYIWKNVHTGKIIATTEDVSGLCAGKYSLTAISKNDCKTTVDFTVLRVGKCEDIASIKKSNPTCWQQNGTLSLEVNISKSHSCFNNPDTTISCEVVWKDGTNTVLGSAQTLTGLGIGTYYAQISCSNGCSRIDTLKLISPSSKGIPLAIVPQNVTISTQESPNCNGKATVVRTGGISPVLLNWVYLNSSSISQTNLCTGNYLIQATDSNGCMAETNVLIGTSKLPCSDFSVVAKSTDASFENIPDGAIATIVSGGTAPFNFVWSNGKSGMDLNILEQLITGDYEVNVTDTKGCHYVVTAHVGSVHKGTPQDSCDLVCKKVTVNYNNDKFKITSPCLTNIRILDKDANELTANTWYLRPLFDEKYSVFYGHCPEPIVIIPQSMNNKNIDQSTSTMKVVIASKIDKTDVDGVKIQELNLIISSGSGSYKVLSSSGVVGSIVIDPNNATQYLVKITKYDPNKEGTLEIVDNSTGEIIEIFIAANDINKEQIASNIKISNTNGSTTYLVSNNNYTTKVLINSNGTSSIKVENQNNSIFSTVYKDDKGNVLDISNLGNKATSIVIASHTDNLGNKVTQIIPIGPVCSSAFSANIVPINPTCSNSSDGKLSITNLPANAAIVWSGSISNLAVFTKTTLSKLYAGKYGYAVVQTMSNGKTCITAYEAGNYKLTSPDPLHLEISPLGIYGHFTAKMTGGNTAQGPVIFSWGENNATGPSHTYLSSGTYKVTGTDSKGCSVSDNIILGLPLCDELTIDSKNPTCATSKNGVVTGSTTRSSFPVKYYWTGPDVIVPANAVQSNLGPGTYNLKVNKGTCSADLGVLLFAPPAIKVSYQINGPHTVLLVIANANGIPVVTWKDNNSHNILRTDLVSGTTYTVNVVDQKSCTATLVFKFDPCIGNPIAVKIQTTISNLATAIVTGVVGTPLYSWKSKNNTVVGNQENQQLLVSDFPYKVIVTGTDGCEAVSTINASGCGFVTNPTVTNAFCPKKCNGEINLHISTAVKPENYAVIWDHTNPTQPILVGACPGKHTYEIVSNNCALTGEITVGVVNVNCPIETGNDCSNAANKPVASFVAIRDFDDHILVTNASYTKKCYEDILTIDVAVTGGKGPFDYIWKVTKNGITETFVSDRPDYKNAATGTYNFQVKDINGCLSAPLVVQINGADQKLPDQYDIHHPICAGLNGQLLLSSQNAGIYYTLKDSLNKVVGDYSSLPEGRYFLEISNGFGCTLNRNFEVKPTIQYPVILASSKTLCTNASKTELLSTRKINGFKVSWLKDGVYLPATLDQYIISATVPGTYTATYIPAVAEYQGCNNILLNVTIDPVVCTSTVSLGCDRVVIDEFLFAVNPKVSCDSTRGNIIGASAVYQYSKYLEEQKLDFRKKFIKKIIANANESLKISYTDSEHHYTLYYYDQANNLVRTVPPAGVKTLSGSETASAITARTDKKHYETNHEMATTFRYNSLNQLVAQDIPDHVKQNLWETDTAQLSLHGNTPKAVAYGDGNKGLLLTDNAQYATLYTTQNTGLSWTENNTLGLNKINDIFQGTLNTYAVGNGGTYLKKEGNEWFVKSFPSDKNLVKVAFLGINGIVLAQNGDLWKTTDAGETWSNLSNTLSIQAVLNLSSNQVFADANGTIVVSTSDSNNRGLVYYSNDNGASWNTQNFTSGFINNISTDVGANIFATGTPGALLKFNVATSKWEILRNNLNITFDELYLEKASAAYARNANKLYKSTDKKTWTEITPAINPTIKKVLNTSTSTYVLTIDGKLLKDEPSWTNILPASSAILTTANTIHFTGVSSLPSLPTAFRNSANGYHYFVTTTGTLRVVSLATNTIYTYLPGTNAPVGNYLDAYFIADGKFLVLTASKIYLTNFNGTNLNFTDITSASYVPKRLISMGSSVYVLGNNNELHEVNIVTGALKAVPVLTLNKAETTLSSLVFGSGNWFTTYTDGTAYKISGTLTQASGLWSNLSEALSPAPLQASQVTLTGQYVAGQNGEIYKRTATNLWTYQPYLLTSVLVSDNFVSASGNNTLYLANASNNKVQTYVGSSQGLQTYITIASSGTISGIRAVEAKVATFTSNFNLFFNSILLSPPTSSVTAVNIVPSGQMVIGDNAGKLFEYNGTAWSATIPRIFPLNALVYKDANTVFAVGKKGTIIASSDGGNTWKPKISKTTLDLTCIAVSGNNVVAGAASGAIIYSKDGGNSWTSASILNTQPINSLVFSGNKVMALAGKTVFVCANINVSGTATFVAPAAPLLQNMYGIAIKSDGTGMMVGDAGLVYQFNESGMSTSQLNITLVPTDQILSDDKGTGIPNQNLRTVVFTDNKNGYITGVNGLIIKSIDGGAHWYSENTSQGAAVPLLALSADAEKGTLVNLNGKVNQLNDMANKIASRFWYDQLGRLTISQNSKQFNIPNYLSTAEITALNNTGTGSLRAYSYTLYDKIGRIIEAGEVLTRTPIVQVGTGKHASQVDQTKVVSFINMGYRRQITRTYYDDQKFTSLKVPNPKVAGDYIVFEQHNLRSRVASTTYQEQPGSTYDAASHYSYDVHGNVATLIQEIGVQQSESNNPQKITKRLDYEYDLISGKVNVFRYQSAQNDQFIHQYAYDDDNRITKVQTSKDGILWEQDATYKYYGHGPLARAEIGTQKVEIQNHAYTLQGWTKGVNGQHFSHALGYNTTDYKPIISNPNAVLGTPIATGKSVFNGNIATWTSNNKQLGGNENWVQQFEYDQLNRLKSGLSQGGANKYKNNYEYDANGNILALQRYDATGIQFDNISYKYHTKLNGYKEVTNKLRSVDDNTSFTGLRADDIDDQVIDNYQYDETGNLIIDKSEKIAAITWTLSGKISALLREPNSGKPDMSFTYDASGNRISKTVKNNTAAPVTTYYVRDPQGNSLAVYEGNALEEQSIYGASRLGILKNEERYYEFVDHLGNVRTVVASNNVVESAVDYYPFGMMANSYSSSAYRYGYNGQEKDDEIAGNGNSYTAPYWEYDARLGRRWNVDPVINVSLSSYACFDNNPIFFSDPKGDCDDCPEESIQSRYLGGIGVDFGSFGNGITDGFISSFTGVFEFGYQMATDDKAREEFMEGMETLLADPLAVAKVYFADKYESWSNVLNGEGTEEQQYKVGQDIGTSIGTLVAGAGMKKLLEVVKVAKFERNLVKIAEEADEATGAGKATVRGTKIHKKFETKIKAEGGNAEVSYKAKVTTKRGKSGSVRADAIYGSKEKPKIAYDLKTGKSGISKSEASKYKTNLPKNTKLKEISKNAKGKYVIKTVKTL